MCQAWEINSQCTSGKCALESVLKGNNFQQVQRGQHAQKYARYFGGGFVFHSMVQDLENMMYGNIGRQPGMQGSPVATMKKKNSGQVS